MRRRWPAVLCALSFGLIAAAASLHEMGILAMALTTGEIRLRFDRYVEFDVSPHRFLASLFEHMLRIALSSAAAGYALAYAIRYNWLQRFQKGLMVRLRVGVESIQESAGD